MSRAGDVKVHGFGHNVKVRHHAHPASRGTVLHTGLVGSNVELATVRWHGTAVEEPLTAYLASLLIFI